MTATMQPRTHREPITLKLVDGSKPIVEHVYAFDAYRQSVFVRLAPQYDDLARPEVVQLIQLEAWDADDKPVPVEQVVRSMVDEAEIFV